MSDGYRRLFLIIVCCTLLAAAGAPAQVNSPHNEVGIFTVENPDGCATAQIDVPAYTEFTAYIVLTAPYNENLGRPVSRIGGFEFRLVVPSNAYVLSTDPWPPMGGTTPPDYMMPVDLPVSGDQVTLMTLRLMTSDDAPAMVYLTPVADTPSSIPGEIAFTDYDDFFSLHVMHPISGSHDVPVFAINWDGDLSFCETVPGAGISFGAVKALYR